jgi:transmembrane sensor
MSSAPPPPDPPSAPELVEAAAAAWLSLRDRGMSAAETAEFVRWLQQDPQHAAVFAELDGVWKDFDRLGAVAATGPNAPAIDGDLLEPRIPSRHHHAVRWAAIGVAAAAAIVVLSVSHVRAPRHTAETAIGAFQKLDLADGSVVQLNTDSAIDATLSASERRVRVVRGEVFFTVAKDPSRPFIVTSGPVAIVAVGTAFNVRQRVAAVEILVTEGRVRVDDARQGHSLLPVPAPAAQPLLFAGERATVSVSGADANAPAATVEKISAAHAQRALAWQERRLEFDAVPLAEVIREFNRYNQRQLVIADSTLAGKRFSGTFRADGYETLVRLLETDFGVSVSRNDREITLRIPR